jgi:predicted membrane-bound mannosyltransferase
VTLVIDQPRPTHSRRSADGASLAGPPWVTVTALVVVILAGSEGLLLRLWLVFHLSSSADEGMVGMVAQAGLHGHFQAFLGGQSYGGTAEPYVISVAFLVFGQTEVVAELVEVVTGDQNGSFDCG